MLYIGGFAAVIAWVRKQDTTPLRRDSDRVSTFNAWLVRAAFFAVMFVGIGDTVVSFLRIEGLLADFVGNDLTQAARPLELSGHCTCTFR